MHAETRTCKKNRALEMANLTILAYLVVFDSAFKICALLF